MTAFFTYLTQIGRETTFGTEVNATTVLRGEKATFTPAAETIEVDEGLGYAMGAGRHIHLKQEATFEIPDSPLTPEQVDVFFQSLYGRDATPTQDGAGDGYIRTYTVYNSGTLPTPVSYTIEAADSYQAYLMTGGIVTEFTIKSDANSNNITRSAALAAQNRGTTTITSSVAAPAITKFLFRNARLWLDNVGSGFGTTPATNWRSFELKITSMWGHKYDGAYATSADLGVYSNRLGVTTRPMIELKYTLTHGAVAAAEIAAWRASTTRAARITMLGDAFSTGGTTYDNSEITIDIPIFYLGSPSGIGEENGESIIEFTGQGCYDPTLATAGLITTVNSVASLPA